MGPPGTIGRPGDKALNPIVGFNRKGFSPREMSRTRGFSRLGFNNEGFNHRDINRRWVIHNIDFNTQEHQPKAYQA